VRAVPPWGPGLHPCQPPPPPLPPTHAFPSHPLLITQIHANSAPVELEGLLVAQPEDIAPLRSRLAALNKRVVDATVFLPTYDQRQFSLVGRVGLD
jgi:hypothetical protein